VSPGVGDTDTPLKSEVADYSACRASEVAELCTDPITGCGIDDRLAVRVDIDRTRTVF